MSRVSSEREEKLLEDLKKALASLNQDGFVGFGRTTAGAAVAIQVTSDGKVVATIG